MIVLFFFAYLAVELYLLVALGGAIGPFLTVCWVFGTAIFGGWIFRSQGRIAGARISAELSAGQMPQRTIIDQLLLLFAGLLLILPGPLGDTIGLLLLLPFVRQLCLAQTAQFVQRQRQSPNSRFYSMTNLFIYDSNSGTYHTKNTQEEADSFYDCQVSYVEDTSEENCPEEIVFDCSPIDIESPSKAAPDELDKDSHPSNIK